LVFGLVFGLVAILTFWFLGGLSEKRLIERLSLSPNKGIWRSAKNGLIAGLGVGLGVGLSFGLFTGLFFGLVAGLTFGLGTGLLFGLVAGLVLSGGVAYIQHFVLRWLLWRADCLPWNYVRFLDYAAERLLLRKVGSGYIFVHRLLMEYFAGLDEDTETPEKSVK
jgi:hypothetical protein